MFNDQKHNQAGKSIFAGSVLLFANLSAVTIAYLGTPFVYGNTIDWVQRFSADNYGNGFEDIVAVAWFALTAGLVFCVARMTTSTLIVMGGLAIASRLFV